MTIIEDMNSIFVTSRFLGCAVHVTVGDDIQARTRRHVIFMVSTMTLYLGCLLSIYAHVLHTLSSNIMSAIFLLSRMALLFGCLFVDAGLTTLWNRKIRTVLAHLRSFDRATNFDNYARRRIVRHVCRALSFVTLMCWSVTGYLSYRYIANIQVSILGIHWFRSYRCLKLSEPEIFYFFLRDPVDFGKRMTNVQVSILGIHWFESYECLKYDALAGRNGENRYFVRVETGITISVLRGIAYTVVDASVVMQILIFVCFSFLISERFHQLCNILTVPVDFEITMLEKGMLLVPNYRPNKRFLLQQIWQLHCTLVSATESLNSVYAVQLLLWISSLSVNAMSRIYTIYVYKLTIDELIRDSIMAFTCTWNLFLITAICHETARQANRVGEIIFSTSSSASMNGVLVQENLKAAAYFQVRKVYFFTVADFVRVDLALLLSIVSAVTTYLVIVC
ncbi:uncharacterized protein LOC143217191 [Lasioglossum baleicum]|uniref:uncharacterized protein LOC143217191 n=1 Tax=Lasioglossum baleicum TaxID=434251 RepID=UPI003FCDC9BF